MAVYQATFGSLSFIFALMISYSYGEEQTVYKNTHIFFPAVALCSFIAFTYPSGGLSIWGPEWSFTAICITLISCFLLTGIYHWVEGYRHLYTMGVAYNFNASMPVSYTHLDVYKRQALDGAVAAEPRLSGVLSTKGSL